MMNWSGATKVLPKNCSTGISGYNISPEQFRFYNENGFLVIKGLIDFESLYAYKRQFVAVCNGTVERGQLLTIVREPSLLGKGLKPEDYVNKLHDICYDEVFGRYVEDPRLLHVLSQFIGDEITAVNSMLINKPPGSERHPPHQDLYYFPFRPADKIIAAWTAIDPVTIENGSLFLVPGSHRANTIYPHGNIGIKKKLYHGILNEEQLAPPQRVIHLEMEPGDTVFFHPLIIHGSGPNITNRYRKSMTCHFMNSNCQYIDVRGTVQDGIVREIEAEGRRRGFEVSFEDQWRYKSKQVKGHVRSNL
ncbi:phytanoyl-CoA dioxygenase, peroxisomal-like [Galleria mellonella]|uniref:phytanoyl-CoA dioxygenase n=1 Tax=Galleria mellonella TaxID=7137 RepID=A0A6J3C830_GALME|nr:phytanoyl-CoA dioxygenase, peroxisomal-like [Galleria mellonella]